MAVVVTGMLATGARAEPSATQVNFSTTPTLSPKYGPFVRDYVVRCNDAPVDVSVHADTGWEVSVDNGPFQSGDFTQTVPLSSGQEFTVRIRDLLQTELYHYYVRCLPTDFPRYTYTRYAPASPQFFSVDPRPTSDTRRYAIVFDNQGVPVWWYPGGSYAIKVLADGRVMWFDNARAAWAIRRLDGSVVRLLPGVGCTPNFRDAELLPDDGYQVACYVKRDHVDLSAYGGPSDATVADARLQEVSPTGKLRWQWKSQNRIPLSETASRWWPTLGPPPGDYYDIVHWNSIAPVGSAVIASFKYTDAVYKIDKSTGAIRWKLGGTTRPESLEVKGDPLPYTFGGQHDVQRLPDGTVTVFDNRQDLGQPRAVRFRIDEQARTAKLLEMITDPAVTQNIGSGSARRLGNGEWLVSWGETNPVGGYEPDGSPTFRLYFENSFTPSADPIPPGAVTAQDLRQAMDAMCSVGCG
jgi:hypothetical protein